MQKLLLWAAYVVAAFAFVEEVHMNEKRTTSNWTTSTCTGGSGPKFHIVQVGSPDGSQLKYFPDTVVADVSDIVEFRFMPKNHTVTESTFLEPCKPINSSAANPNRQPVKTGFVPVMGNETFVRTFRINITDTKPIWLYCGQAKGAHCQSGMVMVINPPADKNVDQYRSAAALVPTPGATSVSSSTTTTAVTAATTTPTTTTKATVAASVTAATPLVSVFNGGAVPTQRPLNLAAVGGLALAGAVALL